MIVVVGSRHDPLARSVVERWRSHGATLLTCEDLSSRGWRVRSDQPSQSIAVVGGRRVTSSEIAGVLTLRPCVFEEELTHIVKADRPYIAAEMSAFLMAWLSELSCPVLNRPTALSLSGPNWRPLQWAGAASAVGIPVAPRTIAVPSVHQAERHDDGTTATVTVVGDRTIGAVEPELAQRARTLASAAGTELLAVSFDGTVAGATLAGVGVRSALADEEVSDAVLWYLTEGHQERGGHDVPP